jgi:hypothetical protein
VCGLQQVQKLLMRRSHDQPFLLNGVESTESQQAQEFYDADLHLWAMPLYNDAQQFFYYSQQFQRAVDLTPELRVMRKNVMPHPIAVTEPYFSCLSHMRLIQIPTGLIAARRAQLSEGDATSLGSLAPSASSVPLELLSQMAALHAETQLAMKLYTVLRAPCLCAGRRVHAPVVVPGGQAGACAAHCAPPAASYLADA